MTKLVYAGFSDGVEFTVLRLSGKAGRPLHPHQCRESALPSYFSWGDDSPASHSLALALCSDALLCQRIAHNLHLAFWDLAIRALRESVWVVTEEELRLVLTDLYQQANRSVGIPLWRERNYIPHPRKAVRIAAGLNAGP